jgi:predicted transcriptional regulator
MMVEGETMKTQTCTILAIILLISVSIIGVGFCQESLQENTTTNIKVQEDGSATWTIENRFLLKTNDDLVIFQQYMLEFDSKKQMYLTNFTERTTSLVERAGVITSRSMKAENFQVTIDLVQAVSASYGIITYRYDWNGFAKVEENRLVIGDVFEGGFYLFQGDALTIQYPKEYSVSATAPMPDDSKVAEQTLTWYGRRNFGAGEPTVILELKTVNALDAAPWYLPLTIASVLIAAILAGLFFFRFNKRKGGSSLLKATLDKMEGDEEKIINLLKSNKGKLYQSLIAKHCGFSTSKTSELLSAMENKGLISRKLKGREKIVTLKQN